MQDQTRLRIIFAGTPAFAAEYLAALLESQHQVVAVYTQPDRPAGRGKKLTASPVKSLAVERGLPVFQPPSLRSAEAQQTLAALEPDLMVVVAYGLILPRAVLDAPRFGCVNVHASLLPRWRGAAPVQRAIEAGDGETGVTIMQMDEGLDTGPMLATARCAIEADDTAATLLDRLSRIGKEPLLAVLRDLPRGALQPIPQNDADATYASKIDKHEALVDWRQSAAVILRKIRALDPFPVAFTHLGGQRIKLYRAAPCPADGSPPDVFPADALPAETFPAKTFTAKKGSLTRAGTIIAADSDGIRVQCGEGCLVLQTLQMPGKRPMSAADILRGNRPLFSPGECFSPGERFSPDDDTIAGKPSHDKPSQENPSQENPSHDRPFQENPSGSQSSGDQEP